MRTDILRYDGAGAYDSPFTHRDAGTENRPGTDPRPFFYHYRLIFQDEQVAGIMIGRQYGDLRPDQHVIFYRDASAAITSRPSL